MAKPTRKIDNRPVICEECKVKAAARKPLIHLRTCKGYRPNLKVYDAIEMMKDADKAEFNALILRKKAGHIIETFTPEEAEDYAKFSKPSE